MNDNDFYFGEIDEDKLPTQHIKVIPTWNIRMIFSTEPALAVIAMDAAAAKWLWRKARITVLENTMHKADKLVGEDASDPRLRQQAAWDVYHDFICDLLRLFAS